MSLPPPLVADARFPKQSPEGVGLQAMVLTPMAALPANPEEGMMARLALDMKVYTYKGGLWVPELTTNTGSSYVFNQPTLATVWTITHPLGYRPSVHTIDVTGDQIIGDVRYPAVNVVQVTFLVAVSGYAYLT